ncbi:hypothetical protein Nepgr_014544 [Nepenthes gracilis]|uniref:C2H2-type domain-containing protein n=1 Tax=Nepenthes gracilis TaxID=150966 RepID=A0AAD3XPY5_NEPGR|nr:hypothetical protein Nepgr_014544 [Nepenthes gracilis]
MVEVMNMPVDSLDRRSDRPNDRKDKPPEKQQDSPPQKQSDSPPPPPKRRDRDSRERRDDRESDRPQNRRGGEYYDRNRSPPPPPPPPRERDRDYKRRLSPGPPPYRDQRPYSPPRRSPPFHPFKRPRREDGYDGRRGSPRGYGPGNRRFGYDYAGGYEREMGGRSGYADDRPHGRYMGRTSGGYPGGSSDWDSGNGGFNDTSNTGNIQREGLMSYKQFIQELEDDVLPSEAERRYQEYKSEYISTQKRTYFEAHKDEEWLKDKYHPTNLLSVIERRKEHARKVAKDFLLDLHSGSLDIGPGANCSSTNKSGQTSEPNSEDEADVGGKRRRHGRSSAKETDHSAAPKSHPVSSEPWRIQLDIELVQALVRKLDSEKGIEDNILSRADNEKINREKSHSGSVGPVIIIRGLTSVKGLEGIELLDTLLTYLWRVHGVDYYGLKEATEPKGLRHIRAEDKSSDVTSDGVEWGKKLDAHWQERSRSQDPLEIMTAKEKIDAAAAEALDPHVRKIRDEKYGWKYGCGAKGCTKLFHAAEFVHKHLKLKHPDLVMELTSKVREDLYFQNYMNDPDAPGGQPIMQQSIAKDKVQRRGPLSDTRLKDDRGNRRERDIRGNVSERFDRSDNLQADNLGSDKGNPDEPMFDNFSGQGMHVAPFAPDIPPPVLMPVPGAGPLGPFVPAPRKLQCGCCESRVALPLLKDPRRLRSYNDLDAPEDEVTVIDYRTWQFAFSLFIVISLCSVAICRKRSNAAESDYQRPFQTRILRPSISLPPFLRSCRSQTSECSFTRRRFFRRGALMRVLCSRICVS